MKRTELSSRFTIAAQFPCWPNGGAMHLRIRKSANPRPEFLYQHQE
ncbi:hypothetical protein [Niabella ginsenosidivorans]|nr:hypothetical protein [Niabella ginsenosidivorans]